MPHRNAPLTETGRLQVARCVVDDGWPVRRAAGRFQWTCASSPAGAAPGPCCKGPIVPAAGMSAVGGEDIT
jgi:hypothetical protein